jgi:hypothetical protein
MNSHLLVAATAWLFAALAQQRAKYRLSDFWDEANVGRI